MIESSLVEADLKEPHPIDSVPTHDGGVFEWKGSCSGVVGTPIRITLGRGYCLVDTNRVVSANKFELVLPVDLDQASRTDCSGPK